MIRICDRQTEQEWRFVHIAWRQDGWAITLCGAIKSDDEFEIVEDVGVPCVGCSVAVIRAGMSHPWRITVASR